MYGGSLQTQGGKYRPKVTRQSGKWQRPGLTRPPSLPHLPLQWQPAKWARGDQGETGRKRGSPTLSAESTYVCAEPRDIRTPGSHTDPAHSQPSSPQVVMEPSQEPLPQSPNGKGRPTTPGSISQKCLPPTVTSHGRRHPEATSRKVISEARVPHSGTHPSARRHEAEAEVKPQGAGRLAGMGWGCKALREVILGQGLHGASSLETERWAGALVAGQRGAGGLLLRDGERRVGRSPGSIHPRHPGAPGT